MLSAVLKQQGHQVGLAYSASLFNDRFNLEIPALGNIFRDRRLVIQAIEEQQPDVLAFSCLTSTYQWALGIAREAKEMFPDIKTVFGGVHVSAVPDIVVVRPEVDFVVTGEGERAMPMILEELKKGLTNNPIPNTRYKAADGSVIRGLQQGFIQDLDLLPFADKVIWEDHIRLKDLYLIMASRGCPYKCSFCFNNFFHKLPEEKTKGNKYVRLRSVDHVIHELKWAKNRYGLKYVDFQDDIFTTNKFWVKEFADRYKKEINVPYQILVHPKYFDDETAKWLHESGCEWIQMGIQTMDEKFKHENLRRYEDSNHIVDALESMNKYGINPKVDHMLGLPGEPIGSQATALKLYKQYPPKRIQTFWTCFLPGTELLQQGIDQGIVSPEQALRLNEGEDFYFFRNQNNIKDAELVKAYRRYEILYKILPVLPAYIRQRIQAEHARWVPKFAAGFIASIFDIYIGFRHGNPEFHAYALHYLHHIRAFCWRIVGLKAPKASPVKDNSAQSPVYQTPHTNVIKTLAA
ncbi:unnamed protein product [Sphagnum balticum]